MKLSIRNVILLFVSFLMMSTSSLAEESYDYDAITTLDWQTGPKTQNILGKSTIFVVAKKTNLPFRVVYNYFKLWEKHKLVKLNWVNPFKK